MKKSICLLIFFFCLNNMVLAQNLTDAKPDEDFFVAQKVYSDGFYDVAINLFEKFIEKYPDSSLIYKADFSMGQCLYNQNRFLEALKKFESILANNKAKSVHDGALYWIAEVYFKSNNFLKAEEFYSRLLKEYPKSEYAKEALYALGLSLFQQQKFQQALEQFINLEKNYSQEAKKFEVALKILECYYNLKDYSNLKLKSRFYLKDFVQQKGSLVFYYFYLAESDYYLGNYLESVSTYEQIIKTTADINILNISRLSMGWAYLKLNQYENAEKVFLLIQENKLDKKNLEPYFLGLAILNYELGKYKKSLSYYDKLLQGDVNEKTIFDAYLGKANSLYNLGDYQQASEVYKQAFNKVKDSANLQDFKEKFINGLIDSLSKFQSLDALNLDINKFVKEESLESSRINVLLRFSDTLEQHREYAKSLEIYKKLLNEYPENSKKDYLYYKINFCLLKLGEYSKAFEGFNNFEKMYPNSEYLDKVQYNIILIKFENKDFEEALNLAKDFRSKFKNSIFLSEVMFVYVKCLQELNRLEEAKNFLKEISIVFVNNEEVNKRVEFESALLLFKMNKHDDALNKIKLLRGKYNDSDFNAQIVWWLGKYYYDKGEYNIALRYFSSLVSDYPKSQFKFNAFYAIGVILSSNPDTYKMAADNLKKVLDGNKDMAFEAAKILLKIYVSQGNDDLVNQIANEVIEKYNNIEIQINYYIGLLYYEKSNFEKAIYFFEKNQTRDSDSLFKLGEIFQAKIEVSKAVGYYKDIVDNFKQDKQLLIKALLRIANIYEDQEEFNKAIEIYDQIRKMNVNESSFAKEKIENLRNNIRN